MSLSEKLLERDAYFHLCWMELKHRRPDLFEDMSKVELSVSGYRDKEAEEDETENDIEIL